jgi:hypothetical protein
MRLQQEEMMRQHQETAAMARIGDQGNANNNANFSQQVIRESAGLAFADASMPCNIHMVADVDDACPYPELCKPKGTGLHGWMPMTCQCLE